MIDLPQQLASQLTYYLPKDVVNTVLQCTRQWAALHRKYIAVRVNRVC